MGITDYHTESTEEMATVPLIAHKFIVAKHKRREKMLTIALVLSLLIGTLTHCIR